MKKEVLDYVAEKTHEMMEAHSCSAEAKAAGQAWLDALGTENEAAETEKYIAELEGEDKQAFLDDLGIKESGLGREGGRHALLEYVDEHYAMIGGLGR